MEPYCSFSKSDQNNSVVASYGCKEIRKPLTKINVSGIFSFLQPLVKYVISYKFFEK
jgi:hypothetical protein